MTTTTRKKDGTIYLSKDLFFIPSFAVTQQDRNGRYIATGRVKPGFEWVFENQEDMIVCEWLNGAKIIIDVAMSDDGKHIVDNSIQASTKYAPISILNSYYTKSIQNSIDRKFISKKQAFDYRWNRKGNCPIISNRAFFLIPGTIPGNFNSKTESYFIPLMHQIKKMRYTQWNKFKPKIDSIEKISTWLKEDLSSYLPSNLALMNGCGSPSIYSASYQLYRPNGLLFIDLGLDKNKNRVRPMRAARINCSILDWMYDDK